MVRLVQDPVAEVLGVINALYPELDISIEFYQKRVIKGRKGCGYGLTWFGPDGEIEVAINLNTPYHAVPEIIAHEIAHVVVGPDAEDAHGPEWEAVFERIFQEAVRRFQERAGESGGTE